MNKSLWQKDVTIPSFEKLKKDTKVDVLIIGGGICGILCAYFLHKANINYLLVEKDKICCGTSGFTTGKITSLHGLIYSELIKKKGIETSKKYLLANENAIKKYKELCRDIDCDFTNQNAYTYSLYNPQKIEDEVKALNLLGNNCEFTKSTALPFEIAGSVCMKNQAQFNPLKFISSISKGLNICENTFVHDIMPDYAQCDGFKIYAEKIIVATHYPFINKHGAYFLKLYQNRSYVMALQNGPILDGMYIDEAENGLSFRKSNNYLLLGGCGARTGKKCGNWKALSEFKEKFYPDTTTVYKWATQDCISLDKIPYIGKYSPNTPNLYVATGFNKWGMTSAMVSATILCDMIKGEKNDYADIFSPSRNILTPQLFVNGFETTKNLIYPKTKRCPHLGCALKWNKAEHTWDCPCHGSRFHEDGKLINNPATKDADV